MSTDPGIWGWTDDLGRLGFTVTFSLSRSPQDVLSRYGADLRTVEHLTREQTWQRFPPGNGGSRLRAGTIGRWGFCFEEGGLEGFEPLTLTQLSMDTEALVFFSGGGASSFLALKDGSGVEAFEPALPDTLHGEEPFPFWTATQKILDRSYQNGTPMPPAHAVLQVIAKHIRGLLDRTLLEGPLLTAFLPDAVDDPTQPDGEQTGQWRVVSSA